MKLLISPSRLAAFLTAIALGGFLLLKRPDAVQPLDVQVPAGADYITHGRYIYTLANCDGCHSVREWTRFGAPVIPAWRGRGVEFPAELGLGRRVASANITTDPGTGLGAWSDGEKIRAIRDGISRDGRPLDPLMPYRRFRQMSDRDVYSLVAYLNTLPAVKHSVTKSRVSFFASLLGRDAPRPAGRVAEPNRGNRVEYGAYLATLAGCRDCHTAGRKDAAGRVLFAGGRKFRVAGTTVVSANITPDPYTGIGRWSERDWLDRAYSSREYAERDSPRIGRQNVTVMPWLGLSQWREDDLKAIFAYLRTQKPVYRPIAPHPVD